jgi:hypothetical protein
MRVTVEMTGSVLPFVTRAGGSHEAACCQYMFSKIIPAIEFGRFPTVALLSDYPAVIASA